MGLDGIGSLNLTLSVDQLYLGYLESLTPEVGMPPRLSVTTFRLYVASDSDTMPVLVQNLLAGHVQFFITGEMPDSAEHELFQPALAAMNMSIVYEDGMDRVDLNASCTLAVLSLAD